MAFTVDQFRTNLVGDGARPNLFEVRLTTWPAYVTSPGPQTLSFLANSTSLPGSDIGITPLQYFGREVKLAGNRTYPEWTVTIINDENFKLRKAFEQWHYGINGPVGNKRTGAATTLDRGYGVNASVIQYGKEGDKLHVYTFAGLWPTNVAPIELAWGTNDQIEEFTVTFAYQYWTTEDQASRS
jgi:T4-like virus tail tube protein gp19